jgi:hypothetical protein
MSACTSGQLRWAYESLRGPEARQGASLRDVMEEMIAGEDPYGNKTLDLAALSLYGMPGVLRPDWAGFFAESLQNATATITRVVRARGDVIPLQEALKTIPCHLLEPEPGTFFEDASDLFNNHDVGVVFNSFNAVAGVENVYLNEAARRLLNRGKSAPRRSYAPGTPSKYRGRTFYQAITPEAVRDALWLYNYGFDPGDRPENEMFVDGAYFREIILNELTPVDRIYVARPINHRWLGPLPTNYADLEDFKTKLNFNGTYDGERHQIFLINKLFRDGALKRTEPDPDTQVRGDLSGRKRDRNGGYHPIELIEVEIEIQRGYLDYVFEDMAVFDRAYEEGLRKFRQPAG